MKLRKCLNTCDMRLMVDTKSVSWSSAFGMPTMHEPHSCLALISVIPVFYIYRLFLFEDI